MASSIFKANLGSGEIAIRFLGGDDRIANSCLPFLKDYAFSSNMQRNVSFDISESKHRLKFEQILSEILMQGYENNPKLDSLIQEMEDENYKRKISFTLIELSKSEKKYFGSDYKLKINFHREESESIEIQFEFIFAPKEFSNLKLFGITAFNNNQKKYSRYFLMQHININHPSYKCIKLTYLQKSWISHLFTEGYYDEIKATEFLRNMKGSRRSFSNIINLLKSDKKLCLGSVTAVNETIRNIFSEDIGFL